MHSTNESSAHLLLWRLQCCCCLLLDELLQVTRLLHLQDDITAANKLAIHVQLGVRWPVAVLLKRLPAAQATTA